MDVNPIDLLIGAAVMPIMISVLNQRQWIPQIKAAVALAACLLMALFLEFLRGPLALAGWRDTALVVAGTAFAAYRLYWQPSGIAPTVEAATSLPDDRHRDNGEQQAQEGGAL